MHISQAYSYLKQSTHRLSQVKANLPKHRFWAKFYLVLGLLGWMIEFSTGVYIFHIKGVSLPYACILASFLSLMAFALERTYGDKLHRLDRPLRFISIIALIGYGAFLLEAFEYMGIMPSIFGKGGSLGFLPKIQGYISDFNMLLLYCVFPVIYLIIGYLLASAINSFMKRFRQYKDDQIHIESWEGNVQVLRNKLQRLDEYARIVTEPIISKSTFREAVYVKYKHGLRLLIEVINDALSAKENWVKHLNLSVEGDSMRQRVIQHIAQVKDKTELIRLRDRAESSLKSYS